MGKLGAFGTLIAVCGALLAAAPPAVAALPIPSDSLGIFVPRFEGAPATARRVASTPPPAHPYMAPNERSNIHNDAYQTDAYEAPGPLGNNTSVNSTLRLSECASVTFDSQGRIETICVGLDRPRLVLMNPDTLDQIASYDLPPRSLTGGDLFSVFTDFSGGGYFYLDNHDRAVVPTSNRHIQVIGAERYLFGLATRFKLEHDYDLTAAVPDGDKIVAVMPDWSGRIWFATVGGIVGDVDPGSGAVHSLATGEGIYNSFAVDETGGAYVVTNAALYRFDAQPVTGAVEQTWREPYANTGAQKPGQTQAGSGTTPTIMHGGLVAITDNADPIDVVVVKRDPVVAGDRKVCQVPVFGAGASATDQSLVAAGDSLYAENNYDYTGLLSVELGKSTTPGITKIDVDAAGGHCSTAWTSDEISPSAVPKVSLSTGLLYTYTKPPRWDLNDAWYLTAIDACTGETRFRRYAGSGILYNNNFSPITLSPDGDAYVGAIGGLIRFHDATQPTGAPANATPAC